MLAILLFIAVYVFRFIPNSYDCYLTARILLSIDIILWFIKSLHTYTCFRIMGPKLIMINRMMYELISYMSIVIVFMFAFGISTQVIIVVILKREKN